MTCRHGSIPPSPLKIRTEMEAADNDMAMTTRTFAIRDDTRTQKRANARDRIRRARWTR